MIYVSFTLIYWINQLLKILESSKNLVPVSKGVSQVIFYFYEILTQIQNEKRNIEFSR